MPPNVRDLSGHIFGSLRVVSYAGKRSGRNQWNCVCNCPRATEMVVSHFALRNEIVTSCGKTFGRTGCNKRPLFGSDKRPSNAFHDLTGRKFSQLAVIGRHGKCGNRWYWQCLCDCGSVVSVSGPSLKNGTSASCGHRKKGEPYASPADEDAAMCSMWMAMRREHKDRVCPEWRSSYEKFIKDVGRRPSRQHKLMLIDWSGAWCPGNALWGKVDMDRFEGVRG